MDFLKTLLAYVALTVAFSVQEGPLPQDVPTPTPLPPNVTASPIPNAPAATDVPTATPTDVSYTHLTLPTILLV